VPPGFLFFMPSTSETVTFDSAKLGGLRRRPMANWMASAVKRPGALRAKAQRAGVSTMAFARSHDTGGSRTARQARLAETFAKFRPKKKAGRMATHLTRMRQGGAFKTKASGY
jgi:hypothetical protein